jgi:D-alanyl-D-alanine carboxypeptidase/D-alanyl-D-alanine-endopeptidase (penicillin-binding protein 4)
MRNIFFLLLILLLNITSSAQIGDLNHNSQQIDKALKEILAYDGFKTASFAFYAVDLENGEPIAEYHRDLGLKPASTLKLLTTATALELLGPNFQFETILKYTGRIDKKQHILYGNIYIKGGGDPSLGSKYFDSTKDKTFLRNWAHAITSLGIDSITGGIIADARIFSWDIVPQAWSWNNMGNYFGAGPCGLSIYDDYYTLYFKSGANKSLSKIEKIVPNIPDIEFDNQAIADTISYDNTNIFGAPYCNKRYIRGSMPANRKSFAVKGSMPDPAFIAALQLDSILKTEGIDMGQKPTTIRRIFHEKHRVDSTHRTAFFTTRSPLLKDIIRETNTQSINLFGEHCLIESGLQMGASPQTEIALDSLISFWQQRGMNTQGLSIYDGSGLSLKNTITPRQQVFLLSYMKNHGKNYDVFYHSLAIAGRTGTLKNMFLGTAAENRIHAKSGTLDGVRTYVGYLTTTSGKEIAFSILLNNFSCKPKDARIQLEKLMLALVKLK